MLVDMAEDNYFQYFIYKVNGDNLLLHLGLFNDLKMLGAKKKRVEAADKELNYVELAKDIVKMFKPEADVIHWPIRV